MFRDIGRNKIHTRRGRRDYYVGEVITKSIRGEYISMRKIRDGGETSGLETSGLETSGLETSRLSTSEALTGQVDPNGKLERERRGGKGGWGFMLLFPGGPRIPQQEDLTDVGQGRAP